MFRIRTKTTWKCDDCKHTHERQDGDLGILLGIPNSDQNAFLDGCLRNHFRIEEVEGLGCDSQECDGKRGKRARKPQIVHGPEILVIQIKRMDTDMSTGISRKVWTNVGIQKRLDLADCSTGALKYQLIGIVAHKGPNLSAGHYVAMVRSPDGGDFVICNDKRIGNDPKDKQEIFGPDKSETESETDTKSKSKSKSKKAKPEPNKWQSYLIVYQKIGGKMATCI